MKVIVSFFKVRCLFLEDGVSCHGFSSVSCHVLQGGVSCHGVSTVSCHVLQGGLSCHGLSMVSFHVLDDGTEKWKQIFPEKELRGHIPNFRIHVSVSDLYIPTIDLHILLQEISGPILGIYKSLTDT